MAGALAKETWVLLPYVMVNFWWLLERSDSIWYPRSKHYRQTSINDWDYVYSAIRKDLQSEFNLERIQANSEIREIFVTNLKFCKGYNTEYFYL